MPLTLKWPSLEERRKQSRLTLLFKFINELIYIPSQYTYQPVLSPTMHTRSNHSLKLQYIYIYIYKSMLGQISTVIPFYPEQYAIGTMQILTTLT